MIPGRAFCNGALSSSSSLASSFFTAGARLPFLAGMGSSSELSTMACFLEDEERGFFSLLLEGGLADEVDADVPFFLLCCDADFCESGMSSSLRSDESAAGLAFFDLDEGGLVVVPLEARSFASGAGSSGSGRVLSTLTAMESVLGTKPCQPLETRRDETRLDEARREGDRGQNAPGEHLPCRHPRRLLPRRCRPRRPS